MLGVGHHTFTGQIASDGEMNPWLIGALPLC